MYIAIKRTNEITNETDLILVSGKFEIDEVESIIDYYCCAFGNYVTALSVIIPEKYFKF